MSIDELKGLDVMALESEAKKLKKELFDLKLSRISGQAKDTSQFDKLRRQIARVLMFARYKQQQNMKKNKAR